MRNKTNGIIGILQRPRMSNEIKSELETLIQANSIRGESSTYSSNTSNSVVGGPIADLKIKDNNTIDFSYMNGANLLFGFYSGEKNIGSSNNNYYCCIDGRITDKRILNEQYGIDLRYSDINMVLKLYVILKASYPNDYIEAARQFGDILLRNNISVIVQDRVNDKCLVFTNKFLFSYTNPNKFIAFSSELPSTFETRYAKLDSNVGYIYNMSTCHLEERVQMKIDRYRNNFMLKNPGVFFDGSLESAVSLFTCQEILHSNFIHLGVLNKSMISDSFLRFASEKVDFKIEGYYPSFESFIRDTHSSVDTYVDHINVDSIGKDFSDSYLYKEYVDIFTHGNAKYIPIFKYMTLPEIILLGHLIGVPYDKLITCEDPIHYGTMNITQIEAIKNSLVGDDLNVYVGCGKCETCKRNCDGFALAGLENPHDGKYAKDLEPRVTPSKPYMFNVDDLSELKVKILSTIQL